MMKRAHMHIYIYAYTYMFTCIRACIHIPACICVRMTKYINICARIYVHPCRPTKVSIYTRTTHDIARETLYRLLFNFACETLCTLVFKFMYRNFYIQCICVTRACICVTRACICAMHLQYTCIRVHVCATRACICVTRACICAVHLQYTCIRVHVYVSRAHVYVPCIYSIFIQILHKRLFEFYVHACSNCIWVPSIW